MVESSIGSGWVGEPSQVSVVMGMMKITNGRYSFHNPFRQVAYKC